MTVLKNKPERKIHRLNHLLRTLESGWEVEEPVLLGAMWRTSDEQGGVYHFILRNRTEDKTMLVSLPPSPELLLFLADKNITIAPLNR